MCGRWSSKSRDSANHPLTYADEFTELRIGYPNGLTSLVDSIHHRYNIAPGARVAILREDNAGRLNGVTGKTEAIAATWWLTPRFSNVKEWTRKATTFNARAESLNTAITFKSPWLRGQRCLIPAMALYEWQKLATGKQPWVILRSDERPFCFGGLWEKAADETVTCAIITSAPNSLFEPIHNRMPLILPPDKYVAWLASDTTPDNARAMVDMWDPSAFTAWKVSNFVSSAGNDAVTCLLPLHSV